MSGPGGTTATVLSGDLDHWAQRRPDAAAVELGDERLSYGELNAMSTTLAAALFDAGVQPGDRVAIWMRKSVRSIAAVHAVLRVGGAYVPVDPTAPPSRVLRILHDCEVACLLTHAESVPVVDADLGDVPVVVADDLPMVPARENLARPHYAPSNLAYILYTSGSRGAPKGVALTHANATAFVDWAVEEFDLRPEDRVSGHAPLHFDLSVLDVFATARAGACLVLIPEQASGSGGALIRLVAERKITVWYSVPSALTRMVTARSAHRLTGSALRTVLFAGEPFPLKHLRKLADLVPGAALYNLYGPTETNVCTFHRVRQSDLDPALDDAVPIGRACPYAVAVVMDERGRFREPLPGLTGELCVAGASRMRGYWGDDWLTAEKTARVPDPATGRAEALEAHRTGDLVRVDADGNLVYGGRRDAMVKIRGHRVELGEVEAALVSAPEVREAACVAVADDGQDGALRIEAYVHPDRGTADPSALRRYCADELPRYMVPSRIHVVDRLPRTSTGKVDRRALVPPTGERDADRHHDLVE